MDARLLRALPWVVVGWLGAWLLVPRTEPDTALLDALRDSVAVGRAQITRDSVRLAAKDDTVRIAFEHAEAVAHASHLVTSAARQRATTAEGETRAVLDSLGASTASLDALVAAYADERAARDANDAARDRERAILYRRVEVSDTVIASLREQLARQVAVDAERARIEDRLRGQLRGAKVRERIAEAAAVGTLVWKVVG